MSSWESKCACPQLHITTVIRWVDNWRCHLPLLWAASCQSSRGLCSYIADVHRDQHPSAVFGFKLNTNPQPWHTWNSKHLDHVPALCLSEHWLALFLRVDVLMPRLHQLSWVLVHSSPSVQSSEVWTGAPQTLSKWAPPRWRIVAITWHLLLPIFIYLFKTFFFITSNLKWLQIG